MIMYSVSNDYKNELIYFKILKMLKMHRRMPLTQISK